MQLSPITLLSALAGHVWGVKLIAESAVTMEWLQERLGGYQETTGHHDRHGPLGKWRNHVEVFVSRGEWWRDDMAEIAVEGS